VEKWRVHVVEALVIGLTLAVVVLFVVAIVNGEELPG